MVLWHTFLICWLKVSVCVTYVLYNNYEFIVQRNIKINIFKTI